MSNEAPANPGDNTLAHALMDAAVDAVIVIGERGIIGECLRSSAELFGYSQEFLMGKHVSLLMPRPDSTSHDGYLKNYLASREAKIIGIGRDVRGLKKSGETFPMHLSVGESLYRGERLFIAPAPVNGRGLASIATCWLKCLT